MEDNVSRPDLDCSVCLQLLCEPVVAPCGHDLCKSCYTRWCQAASNGFPLCPICRAPLPPGLGVCVRLKRIVEHIEPAASKRRKLEQDACLPGPEKQCNSSAVYGCGTSTDSSRHPAWLGQFAQYHWGMAALFAQYQQWMMHGSAQQPPAVTGTPVAEYVEQTHRLYQQAANSSQLPDSIVQSSDATGDSANSGATVQQEPSCRWQSVADVPLRLACARDILAMLAARSAAMAGRTARAGGGGYRTAALAAVRSVEVELYRSARTREEYLDRQTLPTRVAAYIRSRAGAIAAVAPASALAGSTHAATAALPLVGRT